MVCEGLHQEGQAREVQGSAPRGGLGAPAKSLKDKLGESGTS